MTRLALEVDVFTAAVERMYTLYRDGHRVVVSFSGGKDSGAVLEVCIIAAKKANRLPVEVVTRDEEVDYPGTYEYTMRMWERPETDFHWLVAHQPVVNCFNRDQPYFWVYDETLPTEQWMRPMPDCAEVISEKHINGMITADRFPPAPGKNLYSALGLRGQESNRRLMGLHNSGSYVTKTQVNGAYFARPLYDWTDGDVWLAHERYKWDYNCNPYEAPIWMGDYSFKPIGEVKAGDSVIGWAEGDGRRPRLIRTVVEATHIRPSSVVKVTLSSGRQIRCTPDHLWRIVKSTGRYLAPALGRHMVRVVDATDNPVMDERLAGWLGGVYDGEGSYDRIYQNPTHNPEVYAAIGMALDSLAIPSVRLNDGSPAQHGYRIVGGRQGLSRFAATCRPRRMAQIDKKILSGRIGVPDEIVSIEPDGESDVYALTTTTGNYVAWGYASKNSAYDVMHRMGIDRNRLRIAPPTLSVAGAEKISMASKAWPQWFEKANRRLPGLRSVAMFGRRAIEPTRRQFETWEECYQRVCIDEAPEWISERSKRVKEVLVPRHAGHATGGIPEVVACRHCTGNMGSWKKLTRIMYLGDPFAVWTDYLGLKYVEPEFFRPGSGTWGGKPSF